MALVSTECQLYPVGLRVFFPRAGVFCGDIRIWGMQQPSPSFAPDLARGYLIIKKLNSRKGARLTLSLITAVMLGVIQLGLGALTDISPVGYGAITVGVVLLLAASIATMFLIKRLTVCFPNTTGVTWQAIIFGFVFPVLSLICCILPTSIAQAASGNAFTTLPVSFVVLVVLVFCVPAAQCLSLAHFASTVNTRYGPNAAGQLWQFQQWQLGEQERFLNAHAQAQWQARQ